MSSSPKIGDNMPPADASFGLHIDDLVALLSGTLAGGAVDSDEKEAAIDALLDDFRKASKDADKARAAEKKPHDDAGKAAVTDYRVVDTAARRFSWLELMPRTGRTHQLRAHCLLIGTPIIGDGKYTAKQQHADQVVDLHEGLLADIADRMCLHARSLVIERPGRN